MSKGNMFLGYARGKVGSLVFARRQGEQITRPYNATPANPKTRAQMKQRTKWANLVNWWRVMKPFIEMGMQNRKTSQSDYNKFVGLNLSASEAYLLKSEAAAGATLMAPYVITSGSLPELTMQSANVTPLAVAGNTLDSTVGAISAAIIAANPLMQVGDQITVFAIGQELVSGIPSIKPAAFKFILADVNDERVFTDAVEIVGPVSPVITDGKLGYDFAGVEYSTYGGAVVHSRLLNGTLQVSTARIVVESEAPSMSQGYGYGATFEEAATSYGYTPSAFLSPESAAAPSASASIASVTVNGVSRENGGTYGYDTAIEDCPVVVKGKGFSEIAPSMTFGGQSVALPVVDDETAQGTIDLPANGSRQLVISAGSRSFSLTVTYQGL